MMNVFSHDFQNLMPVESYTAPELPMLGKKNPELLRELPSRWQKNAKVVAFIVLAGTVTLAGLTGCSPAYEPYNNDTPSVPPYVARQLPEQDADYPTQPTEQDVSYPTQPTGQDTDYAVRPTEQNADRDEHVWSNYICDVEVRLSTGGAASVFYLAHITEQEAHGIIRARLEVAGLDLSDVPPDYTVYGLFSATHAIFEVEQGLDLFDAERNVAVAFLNAANSFAFYGDSILNDFAELNPYMTVGAFRTPEQYWIWEPSQYLGDEWDAQDGWPSILEFSDETKARIKSAMFDRIIEQVDAFIYILQEKGILEIPSD